MVTQHISKSNRSVPPLKKGGQGFSERLKTATAIGNVLQKSEGTFAGVLEKVHQLLYLQSKVLEIIPSPLREHTWVMNFKEGTLTLATDNAVWTSRLNFMARDLVFLFSREHHISLKAISCKVGIRPSS